MLCPHPTLMIEAMIVVRTMLPSRAPLTFRDTRAMVMASPMKNTRKLRCRRSGWRVTMGLPALGWITIPAFTNPMKAMKAPIPTPMAFFRSNGIAFSTSSRNLVRTSSVIISPSHTITPMAWGQVRPLVATSVRVVRVDAHEERERAGHQGRHGCHLPGVERAPATHEVAQAVRDGPQDDRVEEDDVGHRQPGGCSGDQLGAHGRTALGDMEEPVERCRP